ncbi:universal stress protein [Enterococcus columbae]|uniref:UspA domain-containing protein n=1 Tax=Enterococcus columbae DSM 7374 = ATCC 51263 TaxID=1121865 RepID=S0K0R9_9ENTE|nr:universal stress protein [Enterococcus columbae]EOT38107.1 hypothetical protein OMW_02365 [Enterococcus columbae DSM 7374 = ATCC 51263]EOW83774.1 hypothetical protein I568_01576 [Enterococcus columbae DSM 7374 = ATCC 51263]OJG24809.1 hypothetical protein RR47_GL002165 [Enterococcus columbae DSM 7374 = ATCC 51263]
MADYRRILIPVDGSILADLAYQKAKRYAMQTNARLIVLSVVDTSGIAMHDYGGGFEIDPLMATAKEFLDDYAEDAAKDQVSCETILEVGSAKNAILEIAKDQNIDLIMMGASGTNSFTRLFIGSTTDFIVQNANVDVFVVKTHMDNTTRPTH